MSSETIHGVVTSVDARGAWVDSSGERLFCRVRGRLYEDAAVESRPVAPGDRVRLTRSSKGEGVIEEVLPRRTKLSRPKGPRGEQEQVMAANVDQVAIVVSLRHPPLRPGLIDRLIVAVTNQGIAPLVVVNKIDLGRARRADEVRETFTALGYPVLLTSATEGTGIAEFSRHLVDRVTLFAGHSGVGKSSLLNAAEPSIDQKVGRVSRQTSRGRHTTSRAVLLPLSAGGYVVDTPGVRAFGLWDLLPADLDIFFREFEPLIEQCRFYDCTHSHEPDCAVRAAVERGELKETRYRAYLRILGTLEGESR